MTNSADPDQLAPSEANWSGSPLFANAGFIWVLQDKGKVPVLGQVSQLRQKEFMVFLFLQEPICCGYLFETLCWGISNECPQHMFSLRNKKNI